MKLRFILTTLLFCYFTIAAIAQPAKSGNNYLQVMQAVRTKAVDQNVAYAINVIWKQTVTPESIFFRADDIWQNCIVEKANTEISPENIKKGDRITFKTMSGGRFAIPEQLEKMPTPALFFQIGKQWYHMPVRNIVAGRPNRK